MHKWNLKKLLLLSFFSLIPLQSYALIGMNDYGYGTRSKSMGGTAVASPEDALASASNPAGIVLLQKQAELGVLLTSPRRGYEANNTGDLPFAVASGKHWSRMNYFVIPNIGFVSPLGNNLAYSISLYGNGGLNTSYSASTGLSTIGMSNGVFGSGQATGVDIKQLFINLAFAGKVHEKVSLGVSLLPVIQLFEGRGLAPFSPFSIAPTKVSDNHTQSSMGLGFRIGALLDLSPAFRFGAAYQPRIRMGKFTRYAGLFANKGLFDIPSTGTIGVSFSPRADMTFNIDLQKIWYSDIPALSNQNTCSFGSPCLGLNDGAGFGWRNPITLKLGAKWMYDELWTFRAGYAHVSQVVPTSQVLFNILSPVLATNQFTLGVTKKLNNTLDLNLGTMYAPLVTVKGENQFNPAQTIKLFLRHYEFFGSLTWNLC